MQLAIKPISGRNKHRKLEYIANMQISQITVKGHFRIQQDLFENCYNYNNTKFLY